MGLILAGSSIVFANDEMFQNNLLKMDVSKTPQGGVKVTLYTKKPYNDSVVVNKKSDREYVILMPETANSLTAKPALKTASDVVQNVEVKTQQYSATKGQKGYTKILFSTTKPVEITPHIQTMSNSDYLLNENEYKELMAQTGKKHAQTSASKNAAKTLTKTTAKTTQKATKVATTTPAANAPRPKALKRGEKISQTSQKPSFVQKVAKKLAPQKTQPQDVQSTKTAKTATPVKAEQKKTAPKIVAEKVQAPAETTTPPVKVKEAETTTGTTNLVDNNEVRSAVSTQPLPAKHIGKLQKIKNIIKHNLYAALALLLVLILLILLLLRNAARTARRLQQQKEDLASSLLEKASPIRNYTEEINEDMSWKEKFKTYVDSETQETEHIQPKSENKDLDELFNLEEDEEGPTETAETEEDEANLEDLASPEELSELDAFEALEFQNEGQGETTDQEFSIDEVFGEDVEEEIFSEEIIYEEETFEQPIQPQIQPFIVPVETAEEVEEKDETNDDANGELVQSQFTIDNDKGFYLVDFEGATALVGQIGEEIFVLKRFEEPLKGNIQARLNEKKGLASIYMVKAGSFKALVEVTSDNMKLLIEL